MSASDQPVQAADWRSALVPRWRRKYRWRAQNYLRALAGKPLQPPICESVKWWAETYAGERANVFAKSEPAARQLPNTIERAVDERFTTKLTYETSERYLVRVPHARLINWYGFLVLPDSSFVTEVTLDRQHLFADPAYSRPLPRRKIYKRGAYFSLLLNWSLNYYHFVHDCLARLHQVLDLLPPDVRFVAHSKMPAYQIEALRLLGLESRLDFYQEGETWEFEWLYFAPPAAKKTNDSPPADAWLRSQMWRACNITEPRGQKKLYLSRRDAKRRRIVNEAEVEDFLAARGFETVALEGMSFQSQVELFSQAAVVVSSHGAGLTNLMFARGGTRVIEIFDAANIIIVYWQLCNALGHDYWYLLGDTIPNQGNEPDVHVPLEKLNATLEHNA